MQRRTLLASLPLLAAPTLLHAPAAQAQATGPVKIIVPFPPGGATDIVARQVAPLLARQLNQAVVVENRGGAGGSLGMAEVARAAPDGLTLGVATVSTHAVNPVVYSKLPYDPLREFAPVSLLARAPGVMLVSTRLPVKDMANFIAHARANPGRLTYGTPGVGSAGHMQAERFKASTKTFMVHIPYRGAAGAMNDLLAGQVDVGFDQVASALPHIQGGRVRALAVGWDARLPQLPEVPTFTEVGLPLNNEPTWFGLVVPGKTPPAAVARLNAGVVAVLQDPELRRRCEAVGLFAASSSPQGFAEVMKTTLERMRETARTAKISLDTL
jgi:tripartite-type tricarboxylate transporter receptor subunit TctC